MRLLGGEGLHLVSLFAALSGKEFLVYKVPRNLIILMDHFLSFS